MDIGKAIGFVFEDEEWVKKLLLGAAITLIPIFGWLAIMGYTIAVIRNVLDGHSRPLPDWSDLGQLFTDGLMYWVASSVYSIPLLIFVCPMMLAWILPALAGQNEDLLVVLGGAAGLVSLALSCLAGLYGILLGLVTPVLQIRFAQTSELGACLRFGEVFRFAFANLGNLVLSMLAVWAAGIVAGIVISIVSSILGLILICGWILLIPVGLLMLPYSVWSAAFSGHLFGQVALRASATQA